MIKMWLVDLEGPKVHIFINWLNVDNFSEDFVYDDIVIRSSIAQKQNKELTKE